MRYLFVHPNLQFIYSPCNVTIRIWPPGTFRDSLFFILFTSYFSFSFSFLFLCSRQDLHPFFYPYVHRVSTIKSFTLLFRLVHNMKGFFYVLIFLFKKTKTNKARSFQRHAIFVVLIKFFNPLSFSLVFTQLLLLLL